MPKRLAIAIALGPFIYIRNAPVATGLLLLAVLVLTAITQFGGLFLWFCLPLLDLVFRKIAGSRGYRLLSSTCLFVLLYIGVSVAAIPPLAASFGRVPLPCGLGDRELLGPLTVWTCLLNRHYAARNAAETLLSTSAALSNSRPGMRVSYLDAGFPFFNWFPMFPHLSHRDGRKIDLALLYRDPETGASVPGRAPSPIGYWGYAPPGPGASRPCAGGESWLRWDFDWLQPVWADLELDSESTAALLAGLARSPAVTRILIEPHLKERLAPGVPKIRFQGCAAARHDDHMHIEFR